MPQVVLTAFLTHPLSTPIKRNMSWFAKSVLQVVFLYVSVKDERNTRVHAILYIIKINLWEK